MDPVRLRLVFHKQCHCHTNSVSLQLCWQHGNINIHVSTDPLLFYSLNQFSNPKFIAQDIIVNYLIPIIDPSTPAVPKMDKNSNPNTSPREDVIIQPADIMRDAYSRQSELRSDAISQGLHRCGCAWFCYTSSICGCPMGYRVRLFCYKLRRERAQDPCKRDIVHVTDAKVNTLCNECQYKEKN